MRTRIEPEVDDRLRRAIQALYDMRDLILKKQRRRKKKFEADDEIFDLTNEDTLA